MHVDLSWWPVLTVPFPYTGGEGFELDFTWLDDLLSFVGDTVGPLLLIVGVFYAMRSLFVNWKGGGE